MRHDVWVEVDLGALGHNLRQVKGAVGEHVGVMAVVKANGYGHGYVEPPRTFVQAGADALAVTRIEEAMAIRQAGLSAPILLLAPIQPENARDAVEADLDLTVSSVPLARAISEAAIALNRTARVHAKVDTGMGRLGLQPDEAPSFFQAMKSMPNVVVAGTYTHFANAADADPTPARLQLDLFTRILRAIRQLGFDYGLAHSANSAAIVRLPGSHLDIVRPGTILYGQYPSQHVPRDLDLRPTWKLKARVCEVKELPGGSTIGYGSEYTTRRQTRTAVVPIGFADGFTLAPEGPIYRQSTLRFAARKMRRALSVEINGRRAPVLGRVAMQMIVADVTRIPGVEVGTEVVVPAMRIPTSALVPRVYMESP